ncbi:MAG: hypothetical protein J7497_12695 [Chitinophagaceae bacterium]|nr:hypothetical protein [Chitinophagaceae bacterium]
MAIQDSNLEAIQDIRKMMERSSRFISLSGWSGISAGICALIGAFVARQKINDYYLDYSVTSSCPVCLRTQLIYLAIVVFIAAFCSATFFTWLKSKKDEVAIWGASARRLLWNTLLPMVAGGFVLWRMVELKQYDLVAAASLIFYGLALVNGSKYTIGEIKYLGYAEIITGIAGLWIIRSGLYIWAFGFGILHIIYGVAMWLKHEKRN